MNTNISNYVWNLQCNNTEYIVANELLKMILQNDMLFLWYVRQDIIWGNLGYKGTLHMIAKYKIYM